MNRAYSVLTVKSMDEHERILTGIATTPETDRMGDIVEPKGAEFNLPIPFLWQHDSSQPIGHVTHAKVTAAGIEVKVELAKVTEPGKLKDRLDEAWQSIKAGLVRGMSIGFQAKESARIEGTYGFRFIKWAWLELSAVTIPANAGASIQTIKSADQALMAARGLQQRQMGRPELPGASGNQPPYGHFNSRKETQMKTLQQLLEERAQKSARMEELIGLRTQESRKFTDEEATEFKSLDTEVADLDEEITVKRFQERQAGNATTVNGTSSQAGTGSRGPTVFARTQDPDDKFKGQAFVRMQIAKAVAFMGMKSGNFVSPVDVAEHRWGKTHPKLVAFIKAAVAGGGTSSGEWGAELAQSDTRYTGDFIEYLYSRTVFDRMPLRPVPARIHVKGQDGAATGYWTGESKAIAVSKSDYSDVELTPLKVAALSVVSKELLMDSTPSAEMLVRDSLVEASAQRVDSTFLSAAAASSGVSPAGILNGLSAKSPSGTDAAAVRADWQALMNDFITAKNVSGLVHVMHPSLAMALGVLVNALGQAEFPEVNAEGGRLFTLPVYTGDNVTTGNWIVMKPSDVWKIGDGGVQISMSDSATIEMNDAPAGASDTPTAMASHAVSMFQTESVAFKVVRPINFQKRRSSAVVYLQDAEYGGVVS